MIAFALAVLVSPLATTQEELAPRLLTAAQDLQEAAATVQEDGPTWKWNAKLVGHRFFETDFDDTAGDITVTRASIRVGAGRRLDEKRRLGFELRSEDSDYDFGGGATIGGIASPADDVHQFSASAVLDTEITYTRSWRAILRTAVGAEGGADLGDAFTFGGGLTYTFPVTENIRLTTGGFASTRLEDDPLFYPWLELDWQASEKVHVGREGGGLGIGYDWLEDFKAYVNFSFVERQYRLDDDAPVPDSVLRDDEFAINTGVIYTPNDHVTIELFGGVAVRQITLLDSDDELGDAETDPGGYIALSLGYSF